TRLTPCDSFDVIFHLQPATFPPASMNDRMRASRTTTDLDNSAEILVELGERSYPIHVVHDAWESIAELLERHVGEVSHVLVISDEAVASRWAEPLAQRLGGTYRCDV